MPNYIATIMSHGLAKSSVKGTPSVKLHLSAEKNLDTGDAVEGKIFYADLWMSEKTVDRTVETLRNIGYEGNSFEDMNGNCLEGTKVEIVTDFEDYQTQDGEWKTSEKVKYVNPVGSYGGRGVKPIDNKDAHDIARQYDSVLRAFKPKAKGPKKELLPAKQNIPDDDDVPF